MAYYFLGNSMSYGIGSIPLISTGNSMSYGIGNIPLISTGNSMSYGTGNIPLISTGNSILIMQVVCYLYYMTYYFLLI
jgi:hypothetical protein